MEPRALASASSLACCDFLGRQAAALTAVNARAPDACRTRGRQWHAFEQGTSACTLSLDPK